MSKVIVTGATGNGTTSPNTLFLKSRSLLTVISLSSLSLPLPLSHTRSAGSAILSAALSSPSITQVTVLSRREPYITHPKLSTILLPSEDYPRGFDDFAPVLIERVKDHQAVIWGLGISQTQVNNDDYIK